jgi:hypothetical protein
MVPDRKAGGNLRVMTVSSSFSTSMRSSFSSCLMRALHLDGLGGLVAKAVDELFGILDESSAGSRRTAFWTGDPFLFQLYMYRE